MPKWAIFQLAYLLKQSEGRRVAHTRIHYNKNGLLFPFIAASLTQKQQIPIL
jgi:hypothetical protein